MASDDGDAQPLLLDRASRATRGKRMTKLLDEEIETDEQFWNQDALKEDENDDSYEEEEVEAVDVFDSDFDEDEPEPDEEADNDVDERLPLKKRLIFPGKQAVKKKTKKKALQKIEKSPETEKIPDDDTHSEHQDTPEEQEAERIVRKSTRTSVIVRQAERDARDAVRAALQASMKPIRRKKEGEEKRMTQEEMLLEAAETEIMNLRNLERMLAREEEVKKKAIVNKAVYNGPQIRYTSKDGAQHLEFIKGSSFQSELSTSPMKYPEKPFCVITGLPAKYKDPKTGLPYATKEAFKIIRERFLKEESEMKKPKQMDMGDLFASVTGVGFRHKRKRSEATTSAEMSDLRLGARFRTIPALKFIEEL